MSEAPLPPPPTAARQRVEQIHQVHALYDYEAQTPAELSFSEGDAILIVKQVDAHWLSGRLGNDMGLVPVDYVSEQAPLDTPLHDAAKRGNLDAVQQLLRLGVDPLARDSAQNTPLHWAARAGHAATVEHLLAVCPAAAHESNSIGDTPLHMAAWGNRYDAVRLLLCVPGINIRARNADGRSPVNLARGDEVKALLIEYGDAMFASSAPPGALDAASSDEGE